MIKFFFKPRKSRRFTRSALLQFSAKKHPSKDFTHLSPNPIIRNRNFFSFQAITTVMVSPSIHTAGSTTKIKSIQQFLSNVLSQSGPSSLPYAEDVKSLIRQHLLALIDIYPSLQSKTATFTHNDGRTVNLLHVQGAVPIVHQNMVYNIPVVIWLMESYPRHPPRIYVTPSSNMIIKRPHPYVNPSGIVSHPYLHNWIYPRSNIVDLVCDLSHIFGKDPPLYTRPQTQKPNFPSSSLSSKVRPPYTEDQSEVFRRNAINNLMEKLHVDAEGLRKDTAGDLEGLFNLEAVLRHRDELLLKEVRKVQEEREGLELELQMVLMDTDLLESWLGENEVRVGKARSVEVEEVFEPSDGLSRQILECTAADLAIDDVIYSLDKAVQEGSLPFGQYLRSIRTLSREQFIHRAMAAKVRGVQMQAQVASMAAGASQYL